MIWGRVYRSEDAFGWALLGSGHSLMVEYLNTFFLRGRRSAQGVAVVGEAAVTMLISQKRELFGHFCGSARFFALRW